MTTISSTVKSFGLLCEQVTNEPSLLIKRDIINAFIRRFSGDLTLLFTLLLPKLSSRVYHVQEKQLLAVLSEVLHVREEKLKDEWNKNGCIAETALLHFRPAKETVLDKDGWCSMSLLDFDRYLQEFASASTNPDRIIVLKKFFSCSCPRTTYYFLREVKQDLRLNAGQSTILEALHPNAYNIYKHCASISEVVRRVQNGLTSTSTGHSASPDRNAENDGGSGGNANALASGIELGIPITPMLAAPVRSVDDALKKCPNGAYSEVKYDGERIQVHKNKDKLYFFSRSLKPMRPDKYASIETYLGTAIKADTCILDGEILMVDQRTSVPLPFGTLGSHKRQQFATACPCIYFFDILLKDGVCTTNLPLCRRRELLKSSVSFIRNRVMFSELCVIEGTEAARRETLQTHLNLALCEGLEGLVIKDIQSVYEPRARHWLKIKKDYLDGLADLADLLVIGAWYGSGSKGGQLMTFLMGCIDTTMPASAPGRVKTVCKVTNGLSDSTVTVLTKKYKTMMKPTSVGGRRLSLPDWLDCSSAHVPDMLVQDYTTTDIMMIIGAEFTISSSHTSGISIRFPRVMRLRPDKNVDTATTLQEIQKIFRSNCENNKNNGTGDSLIKRLRIVDASVRSAEVFGETDDRAESMGPTENSIPSPEVSNPMPVRSNPLYDEATTSASVNEEMVPQPTKSGTPNPYGSLDIRYCMDRSPLPLNEDALFSTKHLMICHCAAAGFQWSSRGFMGRLTNTFGIFAQVDFDRYMERMNHRDALGDVVLTEVGPSTRPGRVYIATMIVQEENPTRRSGVPILNRLALERALDTCLKLAGQSSVTSLYFIKPPQASVGKLEESAGGRNSVNDKWEAVEHWWTQRKSTAKNILISIFPSHDPQNAPRDNRRKRDQTGATGSSHHESRHYPVETEGWTNLKATDRSTVLPPSLPKQQLRLEDAFGFATNRNGLYPLDHDGSSARNPPQSTRSHTNQEEQGRGLGNNSVENGKIHHADSLDEVEIEGDIWASLSLADVQTKEEKQTNESQPLMHNVMACMARKEAAAQGSGASSREEEEEEEIEEAAILLRLMGGSSFTQTVGAGRGSRTIPPTCTHVILPHSAKLNRMDRPRRDPSFTEPHVVTTAWVKRCFEEGARFDEGLFHPSIKTILDGHRILVAKGLSNRDHWIRMCDVVGAKIHSQWRFIAEPTTYCIADQWCEETRKIISIGGDVLRPEWLLESAIVGYPLPPEPYFLQLEGKETEMESSHSSLLRQHEEQITDSGAEVDSTLLSGIPFYLLPDKFSGEMYTREVVALIKLWGGIMTRDPSSAQYCLSTLSAFRKATASLPPSTQLKCVDIMWVMECIQKKTLLSPSSFLLLDQVHSPSSSAPPAPFGVHNNGASVREEMKYVNEEDPVDSDSDTTMTVSFERSASSGSTTTVIDE